jgi:acyl dehydratase
MSNNARYEGRAMSDDTFKPENHRKMRPLAFDELKVGQQFPIASRTMTSGLFAAFQTASGDNHPIHYDREYCRRHGHRDLLAHGFQILIQSAAGAGDFPHVVGESLIGFLEQSSRFLKPVYLDDTLYPMLTIADLKPQRTTGVVTVRSTIHNQRGELVMEGEQRYLVRK